MSIANATVHFDTHFNVGRIDPRIYGGFLEHLGRAVYEGVYDPGNPLSDERGFRKDVFDALRPLAMPVVRYPGGNYVSAADWKDGIGPKDKRPRRPDYAWQSVETNQFGTDEFMQWTKAVGTAPMMAVNLGTAGAKEAGELVEYCNLPGGTYWSDLRKQNGHAAPYNVKLWCLGNEMDGPWQAGHVPAEVYAQRAYQASFLMKGLDRSIETVIAGSSARTMSTYMDWDRKILEYCWPTVDYISAHRYSDNSQDDAPWYLAEGVVIDQTIRDYAAVIDYTAAVRKSTKRVYLSFDEWNVWYRARGGKHAEGGWRTAQPLLEEHYNMEDALIVAQYLSAFVRRADVVKVACIAQIVNVIAPVLTRREGLLLQSIYYPFLAFSQHARGLSLTPSIASPTYKAGERGEVPTLDASASYDPASGELAVFLVNRNGAIDLTVDLRLDDRTIVSAIDASEMGGIDLKATNTWDKPDTVKPRKNVPVVTDGVARVTIPAPGFVALRLSTKGR